MSSTIKYIETFAGPGGFSEGAKSLDIDGIGVEFDPQANQTALNAGHRRITADVSEVSPRDFVETHASGHKVLFHASPPCQPFSTATTKNAGRLDLPSLLESVEKSAEDPNNTLKYIQDFRNSEKDPKSHLSLEPLRWIYETKPEFISLEQVPQVLPLWVVMRYFLESLGYSVYVGYSHSEQYGVPQTRKRAILLASNSHEVCEPTPTHSRFYIHDPAKVDSHLKPSVPLSVAYPDITPPYVFTSNRMSVTVHKAPRRKYYQPATTITSRSTDGGLWIPDELEPPDIPRHWTTHMIYNTTVKEASILQSFRSDYPWFGTKSNQYTQVGNAYPPLMAAASIKSLI